MDLLIWLLVNHPLMLLIWLAILAVYFVVGALFLHFTGRL
jgi:hypothetical protein